MDEMYFVKEFITKEKADEYLLGNHLNRPIKKRIDKIKNDLLHGEFELTHQPIAVSSDGELIDGQHRLVAISETGIPAWIWVCHNAPKSTKIDKGCVRTDRESLYMAGVIEKGTVAYNNLTFPLVSFICQRNFGKNYTVGVTEDNKYNVYLKCKDWIDPVVKICTHGAKSVGSKARGAIVLYAMVCAIANGVDVAKLKKWYSILTTGDFYSEDRQELIAGRGVLILKRLLDTQGVLIVHGNSDKENELLGKIMTSIYHYVNGKEVKQIKGAIVYKEIVIDKDDLYRR